MRARPVLSGVAPTLLLAGPMLLAGGCGSGAAPDTVGDAAGACRATWRALEKDLEGSDRGPGPSRLSERWSVVLAGVRYHVTGAKASDCGKPLTNQRKAISELNAFESRVQRYDMELARATFRGPIGIYLDNPVPARAVLGRAGKPVPHATARRAFNTLDDLAAEADRDLSDGWAEAATVNLSDARAVDRVVSDLGFLAGQSPTFRKCAAAVRVLRLVVRQQIVALSSAAKQRVPGER